ncbi:MAG: nitric oxide reductase transcriptional regulator NorR [Myxococcales bacterium]|nr:MAG: nitric oxide reductase transcriptional regulator NorR [Myxococcales bacterium]
MTPPAQLSALLPLLADLARDLTDAERHRRLLEGLRALLPCDAAALLRLDGDSVVALAVDGLSADTLGRRFRVVEHPRFVRLLGAPGPVRFAADCGLPDPYDGLVEGVQGHLPVHDCVGCALQVDGRVWGLLTLDALEQNRFSALDLDLLQAFASLAAASVAAAARIDALAARAEDERRRADAALSPGPRGPRTLIGHSAAHRQLLREIAMVGPSELCVLIQGETGVGKELVAHALHAASPRARRPLVSLNCAALPEHLVESELFGHVRGAFTGAVAERRGRFEMADGGTLFLDEVAELPLGVQAKLLRVLQEGQMQRLGSDREHRVDVRVLAASNRPLADEVRAGRLRADFYHRLSVYPLQVPPLRARGRDVLTLSGFFLEESGSRMGLGGLRLDADAQAALLAHDWPGNVRELEHLLGRSVLRALGRHAPRPRILTVGVDDLGLSPVRAPPDAGPTEAPAPAAGEPGHLREAVARFERGLIEQALARHGGRWAAAARSLGVDRANLARLARRLGVERPG